MTVNKLISKLDPYEQWMVRSNLKTVLNGGDIDRIVATLRDNGYQKIADALLEEYHLLSEKSKTNGDNK